MHYNVIPIAFSNYKSKFGIILLSFSILKELLHFRLYDESVNMTSAASNDVILDCDWFAFGKRRLIKQLSYHIPSKNRSFLHVFRFPHALRKHANYFNNQSVHSHGIPWNKNGFFHLNDVTKCILSLKYVHGGPDVVYWAKGGEKSKILSDHGIAVNNLEDIGCPRFTELSIL